MVLADAFAEWQMVMLCWSQSDPKHPHWGELWYGLCRHLPFATVLTRFNGMIGMNWQKSLKSERIDFGCIPWRVECEDYSHLKRDSKKCDVIVLWYIQIRPSSQLNWRCVFLDHSYRGNRTSSSNLWATWCRGTPHFLKSHVMSHRFSVLSLMHMW